MDGFRGRDESAERKTKRENDGCDSGRILIYFSYPIKKRKMNDGNAAGLRVRRRKRKDGPGDECIQAKEY